MSYVRACYILIIFLALQLDKARTTSDFDSCYSFAGGSVYPAGPGETKGDHQLQYTKAMSKCENIY